MTERKYILDVCDYTTYNVNFNLMIDRYPDEWTGWLELHDGDSEHAIRDFVREVFLNTSDREHGELFEAYNGDLQIDVIVEEATA